jgi:hypothetical protein
MPSADSINARTGLKSRIRFASAGIAQPIRPSKSMLLRIRSRAGKPSRRHRA